MPAKLDYLNQSNTFGDGINYGEVTIDISGDVANFTVDPYNTVMAGSTTVYTANATGFGLDSFGFNVLEATSNYTITRLAVGLERHGWNRDGFAVLILCMPVLVLAIRVRPLTFTVTYTGSGRSIILDFEQATISNTQGSNYFAAHVAGFTSTLSGQTGVTSHYIGGGPPVPSVPEPSTLLGSLLGLGLVGIARMKMRGRKTLAA